MNDCNRRILRKCKDVLFSDWRRSSRLHIIAFFLFISLLAPVFSVFALTESEFVSFHSVRGGFTIEFPKSWESEEYKIANGANLFSVTSPSEPLNDLFLENVNIVMVPGIESNNLGNARANSIRLLEQKTSKFHLLEQGMSKFGLNDASWFVHTNEFQGETVQVLKLIMLIGDRTYFVTCTAIPDTFERFRPVFDRIISSIKFDTLRKNMTIPVETEVVSQSDETRSMFETAGKWGAIAGFLMGFYFLVKNFIKKEDPSQQGQEHPTQKTAVVDPGTPENQKKSVILPAEKKVNSLDPVREASTGREELEGRSAQSNGKTQESRHQFIKDNLSKINPKHIKGFQIHWLNSLDKITSKKLNNASEYGVVLEDNEQAVLLYDDTVFGSSKKGFVLSDACLYYNLRTDLGETYAKGRILLTEINSIEIITKDKSRYLFVNAEQIGVLTVIDNESAKSLGGYFNSLHSATENREYTSAVDPENQGAMDMQITDHQKGSECMSDQPKSTPPADGANPEGTENEEVSIGSTFAGIGGLAVVAGIVLSMAQAVIDIPIKGSHLGYLMIGGFFLAILGWLMKMIRKSK
ncbi:MAG: hypothetical protein P9M14_18250 [Candidatus Alcyoniella australis]|nr:hypothetical protein [Candidatus Alcyoniella australis]